jgi:predicted TIM-barrel fold metal-dependent hydrolase
MIDGHPVIDFHGHVGNWEMTGMFDEPSRMLHAMDAAGVDRACVFNIFHPDGRRANDATAHFVSRHPDRFIGFGYVSPMMPETNIAELTRAVDELGLRAIKIYPPYTSFPLDDDAWHPIFAFAETRGLVVLSHTDNGELSEPRRLGLAAARFPGANFVAGHSGNIEPHRTQAIDMARELPNFYLETCSTYRSPGVIEQLVEGAGADRVLFGSDQPLMDPRTQLGKILTAAIGDREKRLVMGGNACRLLKL